jgi:hypothetical protein
MISLLTVRKAGVLGALIVTGATQAATIYQATPTYDNLWMRPPLASGRTNASAGAVFGSYVAPYNLYLASGSLTNNITPHTPNNKFRLVYSSFGQSFPGIKPDFDFGDVIVPIAGVDTNQAPVLISPPTGAFYAPFTKQVISADFGNVRIDWKMLDGTTNSRIYLISAVPKTRPARIFWTENHYGGPVIDLSARFVTVHYNSSVTNAPAGVDLSTDTGATYAQTNSSLHTVWLDFSGFMHNRNASGLFVLEFFKGQGKQDQIGYEIVEALEPDVAILDATIGSRLLPKSTAYGQDDLIPDVRKGIVNPALVYLHHAPGGGGHFNNWLFAIAKTVSDPSQLEVYWKQIGFQQVQWPFEVDWYSVDWPNDNLTQHYVRSGLDTSGAVSFPTNLTVQLQDFQEPAQHAKLTTEASPSFYTTSAGRSLLRYSSGDDVWFEVVRALDSSDAVYFNRSLVPWQIGQELQPIAMPKTLGFDGASSWLAVPVVPSDPTVPLALTIEAWVKPARSSNLNIFYLTDSSTYYTSQQGLAIDNNGKFWHHGLNTNETTGNLGSTKVIAGHWYHVAVQTEPGGSMRLFVNGVQEGPDVPNTVQVPAVSIYAFGHNDQQLGFGSFEGEMKDIRIWKRILTADEIKSGMYQTYTGSEPDLARDVTGQDLQEDTAGVIQAWDQAMRVWQDWSGAIVSPAAAPMPLSALPGFDGDTSDLTFPALGNFAKTIELKVKTAGNTTNTIIFTLADTNKTRAYQQAGFDTNGHLFYQSFNGTTAAQVTSTSTFAPGSRNHLAFTHENPGKIHLFVNGVEEGTAATVTAVNASQLVYHFGLNVLGGTQGSFQGEMEQILLWDHTRTNQIAVDMNRDVAPGEDGLLHAFDLEQMSVLADGTRQTPDLVRDQAATWTGAIVASTTFLTIPADDSAYLGFVNTNAGTAYNINFYTWPATNSHLFGINQGILEVWWSQTHQQSYMPAGVTWPSLVQRYTNIWPFVAPELVIAGQNSDSAGTLPPTWSNASIYYQNATNQPGFNPNEEHALLISGKVYALRDDLNNTNTSSAAYSSAPYVLVQYNDLENNGLPAMQPFHVIETNSVFQFAETITVGSLIQPPMPLTVLPPAAKTFFDTNNFQEAWKDRKNNHWSFAAGVNGSPTNPAPVNTAMRFYYAVQPTFYFPGVTTQPSLGTEVPWLNKPAAGSDPTRGVPIQYIYTNVWPSDAPVLLIGETLADPKHALPAIRGQKSVAILYDQTLVSVTTFKYVGHNGRHRRRTADVTQYSSVNLIDPTQDRTVSLAQLPGDVATSISQGKSYFTQLPPHLRNRLFYDPTLHQLVFRGELIVPDAGEYYFNLNYLTGDDRTVVYGLSQDSAWQTAINSLATDLVVIEDENDNETPAFDSLALVPSGYKGSGYITLAFNSSTNLTEPGDPISVEVIRLESPLYKGDIAPVFSDNPLDEKLTLRFSGDFGGRIANYEFDWRYAFADSSGLPSSAPYTNWLSFTGGSKPGQLNLVIQGPGLLTLSDSYWVVRYRPLDQTGPTGANWSDWTDVMLAEGWIKRALNGINPFEQRIKDLESSTVNTTVSLVSQAGARWVGDIPLNLNNINNYGLIEIYETILKRGIGLSIGSGYSFDPANDALLLAAGRIHDLYMIMGNEAFADAQDPTIAYGTRDKWAFGSEGSSIFSFQGQVPTLLDEELALLRGRDDSLLPSVHIYPVYNRLYWNFTKSIDGGEAAYALNYNIPNANGDVSGVINESDAKKLYPQGHGDAWGHYLSAITVYYQLLANTNFTWSPRIEAKIIGGVPVSVDYFDERKFAEAAAAKARAGAEIVGLVHRQLYNESQLGLWDGFRDSGTNRAWGQAEWASRAGQGAYFDWAVANSLLPDVDPDPSHQGIQKVDRSTVPELQELAAQIDAIQLNADHADRRLNPLGLARDVVPFDINPKDIDAGKTHFEQVYEKAVTALNNANAVLIHAQNTTQVLRRQDNSLQDFVIATQQSEQDFNNKLVAIYGYPYSDDIGPGKLYPQGYDGPDLFHFQYVDLHDVSGAGSPEITIQITNTIASPRNPFAGGTTFAGASLAKETVIVPFVVNDAGIPAKPATYTGARHAEGEIQAAYGNYVRAWYDLRASLDSAASLLGTIQDHSDRLAAVGTAMDDENTVELNSAIGNTTAIVVGKVAQATIDAEEAAREAFLRSLELQAEGIPKEVIAGLADGGDLFFTGRYTIYLLGLGADLTSATALTIAKLAKYAAEIAEKAIEGNLKFVERNFEFGNEMRALTLELNDLLGLQSGRMMEIQQRAQAMAQAREHFRTVEAEGERILVERATFRANAATRIQEDRYLDSAFRIFRSQALGQYRAAADLASRYVYLAAKSYDYETGLLRSAGPDAQDDFVSQVVRTRSLGFIRNSQPQLSGNGGGDPGLADVLAQMSANWNVLKGRFGFNNPEMETSRFSLRSELLRIASSSDPVQQAQSDETWRSGLWSYKVNNLLAFAEFNRYCIPFTPTRDIEPALVIPFSTSIQSGQNFFGRPLAGGDNAYDSSHFATKIRSVGIWFSNFNSNFGAGLANQPRVYLIPVGNDIQRSATTQGLLSWRVVDQALPIPFAIGSSDVLDQPDWIPIVDSISGGFGAIRQFSSLRAYHDSGQFNLAEVTTNARLIGRSVWNTQWLLIIPGSTLLADPDKALEIFVNGVNNDGNGIKDIKIFFQTYSYSGN